MLSSSMWIDRPGTIALAIVRNWGEVQLYFDHDVDAKKAERTASTLCSDAMGELANLVECTTATISVPWW